MNKIFTSIFLVVSFIFSATGNTGKYSSTALLHLIKSYPLQISAASDISFGKNYNSLWIVSDIPGSNIFEVDLEGNLIQTIKFNGADLEGIAYDHHHDVLWVVEERKRELIKISPAGTELERRPINITGKPNSGLEGITIDSTDHIWIANEKKPAQLLLLNPDFSIKERVEIGSAKDLSGLCWDPHLDALWIVSDESKLLIHWQKTSGVLQEFNLPFKKAEGIAVHPRTNQIYIVSDKINKLFLFEINKK